MQTESQASYYAVWSPRRYGPTVRHDHKADAIRWAERLAHMHPGEEFVVLESVTSRRVSTMLVVDFITDSQLPF